MISIVPHAFGDIGLPLNESFMFRFPDEYICLDNKDNILRLRFFVSKEILRPSYKIRCLIGVRDKSIGIFPVKEISFSLSLSIYAVNSRFLFAYLIFIGILLNENSPKAALYKFNIPEISGKA